jgi:hypothetical protein
MVASSGSSGTHHRPWPFFVQEHLMDRIERRVRQRARKLWDEAGRPAGGSALYMDPARELVAIEDRQSFTTKPLTPDERAGPEGEQIASSVGPTGEPVEPIEAARNVGEFPTLTDQGEEQTIPRRRESVEPGTHRPGAAPPRAGSTKRAKSASTSKGKGSTPARRTPKSRKTAAGQNTAPSRSATTRKKAR